MLSEKNRVRKEKDVGRALKECGRKMSTRMDLFFGKKVQNWLKNRGKMTSWQLKADSIDVGKKNFC